MALVKTPVSINFTQGVNTKSDPFQLSIGQFESLKNGIFNLDGLIEKRNGYELLTTADSGARTLATFNAGLVILGDTCQSFNANSRQLTDAGLFQPLDISTVPMVRRATSQTTCDVALSSNGTACSTWLDSNGSSYYQISMAETGQILVPAVALSSTATMPRAFVVGNFFIVTYLRTVTTDTHLDYICIPIANPSAPHALINISTQADGLTAAYDAYVYNNRIYIALNCNDIGGAIRHWSITASNLSAGTVGSATTVVASADLLTIIVNSSNPTALIIWVAYVDGTSVNGYALNSNFTVNLPVTAITTSITNGISQITSSYTGSTLIAIYEKNNIYSYTPAAPETSDTKTDYIVYNTLTLPGIAGTETVVLRGVGIASKAIISTDLNKTVLVASYGQQFQPTNFLIDLSGNVLSRFAYSNGKGYLLNQIQPNIYQDGDGILSVGYLFADLLQPVNKTQGESTTGVYSQLGINLANFEIGTHTQALEIGGGLHASGGMLWQYDGVKIREHGFNVYPEDIGVVGSPTTGAMTAAQSPIFYQVTYEWTDASGMLHRSAPSVPITFTILTPPANFTGNRTSGSATLAAISSFTGLQVGQAISGTGIPASTFITALNTGANTLTMSNPASSGTATSTTVTPAALTSLTVNVPTLRQTYKTDNKVRIVIYRWSTTQQTYYRITSISSPLLNNPAVDSVSFSDIYSDAQIIGNDILYTNGGVLENICAPGSPAMTLWGTRLFMVDSEDRNLIWYSKQVIEATPIEMSDLLTLFVAPTTGAQGSTGPITALGSMDDKLIIFKKDAIYYITGAGPDNTGANNQFSDPVFITGTVGCANQRSIVLTPNGIIFQSDKGLWMLGRDLSTSFIGAPVQVYTEGLEVTSGMCIPGTNQVRFTLDNNTAVMYDYFYARWSNWDQINATSSVIYTDVQAYLNPFQQVVIETPNRFIDISSPVLLGITTGWINLSGVQGFERFYHAFLLGVYYTPFKLNVSLAYDYNDSAMQNIIVSPDNNTPAYGDEAQWGGGQPWGGPGNKFSVRIFPKKQKCESFKLTLEEVYDSTYNITPGKGLTLSGMNLIVGQKKGSRTQSAKRSFG